MMCTNMGARAGTPAAQPTAPAPAPAPAPAQQSAAAPAQQPAVAATTSLAAAQTFDEIAAHMANKHQITVAPGLALRVSVDNLRTACEGVEAVINEFPAVARYVRSISGGARGGAIAQVNARGEIQLNTRIYRDAQSLNATVQQGLRARFHPAGAGAREFTAHEVGHMLGMMLCKITVRSEIARQVAAGGPRPTHSQIRLAEVTDWNNNTTSDKIIGRAVANINQRAQSAGRPTSTRTALVSHVSGYAKKDSGETLAECVADYIANRGNARRLSREVWRILKNDLT